MEENGMYSFTSSIRRHEHKGRKGSTTTMTINVPKGLHRSVEVDSDPPHTVQVTAKILYPKKT